MTGHEIARQLQDERPCWVIWYGERTRHFWALALWVPGTAGALEAATPSMLITAINNFEMFQPKPRLPVPESPCAAPATAGRGPTASRQRLRLPAQMWAVR